MQIPIVILNIWQVKPKPFFEFKYLIEMENSLNISIIDGQDNLNN